MANEEVWKLERDQRALSIAMAYVVEDLIRRANELPKLYEHKENPKKIGTISDMRIHEISEVADSLLCLEQLREDVDHELRVVGQKLKSEEDEN